MELILVRHAKAGGRDAGQWPDDSLRPLTGEGREKMRAAAAGLRRVIREVDRIVTSPYLRAAETAEILAAAYGSQMSVETCKELCPGGSFPALVSFLRKRPGCLRVMLVGHETDLSQLAAALIGGDGDGFAFKKGGACLIEFEREAELGSGRLVWWLTPALLRALG